MAFVITQPCMSEKAGDCVDVCPVDCIEPGEDQYYIDPISASTAERVTVCPGMQSLNMI